MTTEPLAEQNRASTHIDLDILKRFIPFQSLPQKHLKDLAKHARIVKVKPKSLIFKRGVPLKEQYYLVSGELDLCDADFGITKVKSDAEQPATAALNASNPTARAAVATTPASLLLVNSDRLDLVLTWSQAGDYLVQDLHENEDEDDDDWMSDLLQSNLLQKVPPSHIQQLFASFKQENFRKGAIVIAEGDVGETFYVLQNGTAQVFRSKDAGEEVLANLTAGRFFGEEALISEATRNASVRMLTDGACMKLDKATFNKLLKEPVISVVSSKKVTSLQSENPKVRILDLRTLDEVSAKPLDNAMHIPLIELRQRLESLDKELTYITHAINGRRAELGAYLLNDAGYEALVMK